METAHWVKPDARRARSGSPSGRATACCASRCISALRDDKTARRDVGARTRRRQARAGTAARTAGTEERARRRASRASRATTDRRNPAHSGDRRRSRSAARSSRRSTSSRTRGRTATSRCRTATRCASRISRRCSGPSSRITKGELLRYYVEVSPLLLPAVDDRPLVMKRFPERRRQAGVLPAAASGSAAAGRAPRGPARGRRADRRGRPARSADRRIADDAALHDAARGDLAGPVVLARGRSVARRITSRSISIPGDGATFDKVLDVARWVKDELDRLGMPGVSEDVRVARPAHLHSAAAEDDVRHGPAALPDDRDARRRRSIRRSRRSSAW